MNACSGLLQRALRSKSGWDVPDCNELRRLYEASKRRAVADNAGFRCPTAQPPLPQQPQATQPHDPHESTHAPVTVSRKTWPLPQPRGQWAAVSPARQREPPSVAIEQAAQQRLNDGIEQAAQQCINERNEQVAQQPPESEPHESPESPEPEPHSVPSPPPPPPPPRVLPNAHYYIDRNEPMLSLNLEEDHAWHFCNKPRPPPSGPEPSDCDKRPVTVTGAEPTQPSACDTQPVIVTETEPTDALLMRPRTPPRKAAEPEKRPSLRPRPNGEQVVASAARQREHSSDDIEQAVRQRINDHIEHGARQRLLERAEKALQQAYAYVATHGRLRKGDIRQLGLREVIHDLKVYIQAARRPIGARTTRPSTTVKAVPKPWKPKLRVHRQWGGKRGKIKQRKTSSWSQSGWRQGWSRSGWSSWSQEQG